MIYSGSTLCCSLLTSQAIYSNLDQGFPDHNTWSVISCSHLSSRFHYMSILSLNRRTPFAFKTPSMPSGSLGKGSLICVTFIRLSPDLSVTSTSPCALIASISAGTISYYRSIFFRLKVWDVTYQKSGVTNQAHEVVILGYSHDLFN